MSPTSSTSSLHWLATLSTLFGVGCALALCPAMATAAVPPVTFSRQILPLLQAQCIGCHGGASPASGYSMESRERIISGGRHGAAIIPGKGSISALVRYLTGDLKPKMPPAGSIDLERIALVRRWIDEGARVDSMTVPADLRRTTETEKDNRLILPHSSATPTHPQLLPAPVTALEYSPNGIMLAVSGYRTVRLIDSSSGNVIRTLRGCAGQVQALAWSPEGTQIAAAGGEPGASGEVVLFDAQTGQSIRSFVGHTEVVYAISWRPNSREFATGSLDKTVRVWNADTGVCTQTLKDHADAVFGVAYRPDGQYLASGSADRSVKIFDTKSWHRIAVLTAHQDTVTHVAFSLDGALLATCGTDKQLKVWKFGIDPGKMENPLRSVGEGDTINSCAFSADGKLLVLGTSNHIVKVYSQDGSSQKREFKEPVDWVYSVAISADSQTIAAGTQDGQVYLWSVKDGSLMRTIRLTPSSSLASPEGKTSAEQTQQSKARQ